VVTAYALAFGSLLLIGGKLSDLIGRNRTFMAGLAGFAAASALAGGGAELRGPGRRAGRPRRVRGAARAGGAGDRHRDVRRELRHWRSASENASARCADGSATFTMVTSSNTTISCATLATASTHHRRAAPRVSRAPAGAGV
jgi:hypothetical protein